MNLKIMTLNIERYDHDWPERKKNIIRRIKKEKPDIVFMQEVFDDTRYQKPGGDNQLTQLNKELKYKHTLLDIAEQVVQHGNPVTKPVFDCLGCLTNLPVCKHAAIHLEKKENDRHFRAVQIIGLQLHGEDITFYNAHYSNNDDSELQLKETMKIAEARKEQPIILGDLNILSPEIVAKACGKKYICSYDVKKYISIPSKNETLDYIIIPKNMKFKSIICDGDGYSDHRPLTAEIETKS